MQRIRKAVIPAAGFGTRFLPATYRGYSCYPVYCERSLGFWY